MDHHGVRPTMFLRFTAGLAIVVALLSACAQRSSNAGSADEIISPIAHPTLEEVTAEEAAQAEEALRESGIIERINGGQPWTVDLYTTSRSGTKKIGVSMSITWEDPVTTDGPWMLLRCQDTVTVRRTVTWHNLTAIAVVMTLDGGEIISFTAGGLGNPDPATYDATPAGPTPYADPDQELDPLPKCPPGLNDD